MHFLYIISALLIWSSVGVFVRIAGLQVHLIFSYSLLFAIIIQSPMFLSPKIRKEIPQLRKMAFMLLMSALIIMNSFTYLYAYTKTSIANTVFTHYIAPVIVALLAPIILKERITYRVVLAIILSSFGLWTILGGVSISFDMSFMHSDDFTGIMSGLASGVFYAMLIMFARIVSQKVKHALLVFFQNCIMLAVLIPFMEPVPVKTLPLLAAMGVLHSTIAPNLYYHGLKHVQASRAAVLGYFEPLGAIIFGMLILSEVPGPESIIGGILIIISGYIVLTGSQGRSNC